MICTVVYSMTAVLGEKHTLNDSDYHLGWQSGDFASKTALFIAGSVGALKGCFNKTFIKIVVSNMPSFLPPSLRAQLEIEHG